MKYLYSIILLVLFPLLVSFAQEDSTETPEPFTRADNECYEGGTMEGRCNQDNDGDGIVSQAEVDWAWSCGWYIARFNDGSFGRGDVPFWCSVLLPHLPRSSVTVGNMQNANCIPYGGGTYCLIGNYATLDWQNDGIIEIEYYIIMDSLMGDGNVCPTGTIYRRDVNGEDPNSQALLVNHGFVLTDDVCEL